MCEELGHSTVSFPHLFLGLFSAIAFAVVRVRVGVQTKTQRRLGNRSFSLSTSTLGPPAERVADSIKKMNSFIGEPDQRTGEPPMRSVSISDLVVPSHTVENGDMSLLHCFVSQADSSSHFLVCTVLCVRRNMFWMSMGFCASAGTLRCTRKKAPKRRN